MPDTTEKKDTTAHDAVVAQYSALLQEKQAKLHRLERLGNGLGIAKIAIAAFALGLGLWFLRAKHGGWLFPLPVLIFVALAIWHEQVLRALRALRSAVAFYERGLARLENRWAGTGETGERFLSASHPYARDLDLFGSGSLFELLSTARTRAGEETLARWLQAPAPVAEIRARQSAVRELSSRLDLRERLFTAGGEILPGLRPELLTAWAERQESAGGLRRARFAAALALAWAASVVGAITNGAYFPVFLLTVLNFIQCFRWGKTVESFADETEEAAKDLGLLARVLRLFEEENFADDKLRGLQEALRTGGLRPSEAVRKLARIVSYLEARRNPIVRVFDGVLFYSLQLAFLAERWRARHGQAVRGWLTALGEMEALCALAGYAAEHPEDVWPEFVEGEGPLFEAEGLAHPLLPAGRAVCNDVNFDAGLQLIVLSGPNMAGKSTFIRGLGANAVLAQCGAPVRARRLRMSPLAVGASICVLDSLQGGISRFYAELQRLKLIVDLTEGGIPVLFLLDELLSGTNSFDRRKGTESIVRALVRRGAIGLVTTHDLALTEIPATLNGAASNCHFEDRFEAGKLIFDYKLKPGIVQTSNALQLMRSIGLPGEENAQ